MHPEDFAHTETMSVTDPPSRLLRSAGQLLQGDDARRKAREALMGQALVARAEAHGLLQMLADVRSP
jgi:hypothetical protein